MSARIAWVLGALALVHATDAHAADANASANANANTSANTNTNVESSRAKGQGATDDMLLDRLIERPHTVAELQAGIIALPNAPISQGQRGGDTPFGDFGRGDATLQTGLHVLFRFRRDWALGAGALFAPSPTSDPEYGGLGGLPRTHARSYLFMGGDIRYIPVHFRFLEAWVGASVGGVVVADRFETQSGAKVPQILGTREVTIRSEGFAAGLQVGGTYYFSENLIGGVSARGYGWFLPTEPRCSAIGDCATLSGNVVAVELGLSLGYRIPL